MCILCQPIPLMFHINIIDTLTQTNKLYVTFIPTMLTSSRFIKPELKSVEETQNQDFQGEDKSVNTKLTIMDTTSKKLITNKKGTPIKKALENY